jgi:hypothetical protein
MDARSDEPDCLHGELWLARDGFWYCARCEPPHWPFEVVERATREEQLRLPDESDRYWPSAA